MQVYAVFKEGTCRHGCPGVFTDMEAAIGVAMRCMDAEIDWYHTFDIVPLALDGEVMVTKAKDGWSDTFGEAPPVAIVSRSLSGESIVWRAPTGEGA